VRGGSTVAGMLAADEHLRVLLLEADPGDAEGWSPN
jgi:hypothetical protein